MEENSSNNDEMEFPVEGGESDDERDSEGNEALEEHIFQFAKNDAIEMMKEEDDDEEGSESSGEEDEEREGSRGTRIDINVNDGGKGEESNEPSVDQVEDELEEKTAEEPSDGENENVGSKSSHVEKEQGEETSELLMEEDEPEEIPAGKPDEGGKENVDAERSKENIEGEELEKTSIEERGAADASPENPKDEGTSEFDQESNNDSTEQNGEEREKASVGKETPKSVSDKRKSNEGASEGGKTSEDTTKANNEPKEESNENEEESENFNKPNLELFNKIHANVTTESKQDRFVKVKLRLPPAGAGKLGMILQEDKRHDGLPRIMNLAPDSPFRDVIPPDVIRNYWVIGIKDEDMGEANVRNSTDLQRELVARRRKDEETLVEISFERRSDSGIKKEKVGEMAKSPVDQDEEEEERSNEPPRKKKKLWKEACNIVKVTVRLPPAGSGKLGMILQDNKRLFGPPHHFGLPIIMELTPDSPFNGVIPPPIVRNYMVVGVKDEEMGEAEIRSSADLQTELIARRRKDEETLVELSFERRIEDDVEKEKGKKKTKKTTKKTTKKKEKQPSERRRSPRKKKKVDYEESKSTGNTVSQQDRFVKVTVQLPPEGKMGLIIQDDKEHYGLPMIMAVSPDSPFQSAIPPNVVQNHWVIGVKDAFLGEAKTLNSKELQRELTARRRQGEVNPVEISFAKRSGSYGASQPQQQQQQQQSLPPSQLGPPAMLPNQTAAAIPQQQMMNAVAQQMALQQAQIQQQLLMRQQLAAAATAPAESTHGRPTNERVENPVEPKEKLTKKAARDETVRKALSEYFEKGETRSINEFCHSYSKLYAAISKEVTDHPGLREIRDRRKGIEGGFTEEDAHEAMECINEIYSCDFNKSSKKRKHGEEEPSMKRKKTQFPPLIPKAFCKGIQSKAVEDYYANKHCDNNYLHEHCRLSNFRGWRHKDCLFIAELDKNERCAKCRSAYSNTNMARTPNLFQPRPAVPTMEEALLPKASVIRQAIENRMEALKGLEDVPNDPPLALASKLMKLKGKSKIELDKGYFELNRSMFVVCEECGAHMLKKKRINTATICEQCRKTKQGKERLKIRSEAHKEARVAIGSHVPFSKLTHEEAVKRYGTLSYEYKQLVKKCSKLEGKDAKARAKAEQSDASDEKEKEFRAPLLPWPFYLNYNPIIAQDYSVPTTVSEDSSAPKKRGPRKGKGKSPKKITLKESGRVGDIISASKDAEGDPPVEEEQTEEIAAENIGVEDVGAEDVGAEEIADEPLDYASVESSQEEDEDEVPPPDADDDDDDEGVDDSGAANLEENGEFDGQLV